MSTLVIVESAAKAKTIKKCLGSGYDVIASMGHIRDLPVKRIGVDVENNFEPKYTVIKSKKEIIQKLKDKSSKCEKILLATDPDREGEAISWHLACILKLDLNDENRITFNEITKFGITNGINNPRKIDMSLVEAQQARRILDRIVGYKLSPFLCQKIQKGLSAGRVQSVALKIIVKREEDIREFVPQEYWQISASLIPSKPKNSKMFTAQFWGTEDGKIDLNNEEETNEILKDLEGNEYVISKITKGKRNKNPAPPFMTSTLVQEAARKLNFTSKRTMKIAQELYEGIDIEGIGTTGLITYMRTDSLRVSSEAISECRELILKKWGKEYLFEKERVFKTKANSQDAHEAIRPTTCNIVPEDLKKKLTSDQYKLYNIIWQRFVASQMSNCVQNTLKIKINAGKYIFKASGSEVFFDGFTILYVEGKDEKETDEKMLPNLASETICKLKSLVPSQHFTEPPARFTEASLIKFLEENGIGRPSTYAPTISVLTYREYVIKEGKALKPTELGEVVSSLMSKHFPEIVNLKFTARMENKLDTVEENKQHWADLLKEFYEDFEKNLETVKEKTKDLKIKLKENETDIVCDKCGEKMVVKRGRYGKFIACPGYPDCKNIKKFMDSIGVECPKCGGSVIKRTSVKGRTFYGCSHYPECDFASWLLPTNEKCPNCNEILYMSEKKLVCKNSDCNYQIKI